MPTLTVMAGTSSLGLTRRSLGQISKVKSLSPMLMHLKTQYPRLVCSKQLQSLGKACGCKQSFAGYSQLAGDAEADGIKKYIPRRTLMYIPGHDMKKLKKIPQLKVDCAVLECEDGVALTMKGKARENIKDLLQTLQVTGVDVAFRVNSVASGLMEHDLNAVIGNELGDVLDGKNLPQTILVPKVDSVEDLNTFTDVFRQAKLGRKYVPYLITYVESAEALINMENVLRKAMEFSRDGHFKMDGVVFGSDDFCADIGAERTLDAAELVYARQKIVALTKAFRIQAIDMVHIDIQDKEGLQKMSELGAKMGFTGKQIIHPSQVAIVNDAFMPKADKVEWASELIKAFEEHQAQGRGAFTFRGHMIDMPLLRQAKNVMAIIENIHKS